MNNFDRHLTRERNLTINRHMLERALLWIGFWIAHWHTPKTKFYEPTGAELIRALKLSSVQAKA